MPDLVITVISRSAGHSLLGVRRAGGDVHRVDGFFGSDIAHMVRQPHVDAGGAVDAGDVGLRVAAVDVGLERAARRVGDRVLEGGRSGARHQVDQHLVVPVAAAAACC